MRLTDEQRDWLTLTLVPGVGSAAFIKLLARFRTPSKALAASRGELAEVVGRNIAERITQYAGCANVPEQEQRMAEAGATLLTLEDEGYPLRLAEIYDPPLVLFVRGTLLPEDEKSVAIVGTRRASAYGLRMAERFAYDLACQGVTIVSGMASGIDAAAHEGAIKAGGRTIAVLGNGVDIVYPRENEALMREIAAHGCVISQFPMGQGPSKGSFPYRNRIISGMSMGSLIVEAPLQSGSLITARQAADQGREVYAIPGQADSQNSAGCHRLIQEGAKLVTCARDVLIELGLAVPEQETAPEPARPRPAKPETQPAATRETPSAPAKRELPPAPRAELSPQEERLLAAMKPDGSFIDELALLCQLSISEALSCITMLELKGQVRQFSGKRFAPR